MRVRNVAAIFAAGLIAGCMAAGPPLPAQSPPAGEPPSSPGAAPAELSRPLIIDRTDLRIGTTVQFRRVPSVGELHDLTLLPGLAHIVISFSAWPTDFEAMQSLTQVPEGADLIAVLPGYPPSRAAVEAWRYVNAPLRVVVVVDEPPLTVNPIDDLNSMPGLERVIAQMDQPSRAGFERLQRPLSFRLLMD